MICSNCGNPIPNGSTFCTICGKPATGISTGHGMSRHTPRTKKATGILPLLSLILGAVGAAIGLAFAIVSIVLLADKNGVVYGIGGTFMIFAVTIGIALSTLGLVFGIMALRRGKSALGLAGVICGGVGVLLGILAFIFVMVVSGRASEPVKLFIEIFDDAKKFGSADSNDNLADFSWGPGVRADVVRELGEMLT